MTRKTTSLGMLLGAATLALGAIPSSAEANTVVVQQADPEDYAPTRIRNGIKVLKPQDEEHVNEQPSFGFDPVNQDSGIVVMMSTGRLDGPAGANRGAELPQGNIQGACMPLKLVNDASTDSGLSIIPQVNNFKYISDRTSEDNRAYHHPEVEPIGGGRYVITANWDRNNNTNTDRYLQVVDSQCNLIPLTSSETLRENNTSTIIMAKNNDNCSGRMAGGGGGVEIGADGKAYLLSAELCNGNGADDGWANYLTVDCATDGSTCAVQKMWDTSFIDQEERSRGRCEMMDTTNDGSPETAVCCGTEGNSQPQRDGVWCAGIDLASGDSLWKERVAYRGETAEGLRTYAMRIKMLAERRIDGGQTGKLALQWQMHRGNNNNNKKGGYDDAVLVSIATPSRTGLNMLEAKDVTNDVILSGVEMTHTTMVQTFTGSTTNPISTFGYLAPNHNGSSVAASMMNIPFANNVFEKAEVHHLKAPFDGQKYSKYLGNNPNNQGRNFNDCHVVPNPFMGDATAKSAGIPVVNLCALTGKMNMPGREALETEMGPALKPDLMFEIWTSLDTPQVEEPEPEPTPEPGGEPGGEPTPEPTTPGTGGGDGFQSGGCSTGGSSTGGFAMMLLGFAMVAFRRRRSL